MNISFYNDFLLKDTGFKEYEEKDKLSLEEIENIEKEIQITFCSQYKSFLQEYNGCSLKVGFQNKLTEKYKYIALDSFMSLGFIKYKLSTEHDDFGDKYNKRMYELKIFPFMSDGTGYSEAYMGFGKENFGEIYVSNVDDIGNSQEKIYHISDSFTEFMDNFAQVY
ncbi:MAG: SMI1/KNR4 family protein [Candidatus Sericytochromatia bacterium]